MHDRDKARCRALVEITKFLFPDTVNLVPIIMSALNGRANPVEVHDWLDCDCPVGEYCGICSEWRCECDCLRSGRR